MALRNAGRVRFYPVHVEVTSVNPTAHRVTPPLRDPPLHNLHSWGKPHLRSRPTVTLSPDKRTGSFGSVLNVHAIEPLYTRLQYLSVATVQ